MADGTDILTRWNAVVSRLGLTDEQAAVATGVTSTTVRMARHGVAPVKRPTVARFVRFLERYESATTRDDVRVAPFGFERSSLDERGPSTLGATVRS
jgi:hypothetical protein